MAKAIFEVEIEFFRQQALDWADQFEEVCFFQTNGYHDEYSNINSLLAVHAKLKFEFFEQGDTFEQLEKFRAKHPNTWMPGFFSYDLKNETESLTSRFENPLDFPEAFFFIPRTIIKFWEAKVEIESDNPQEIYAKIIRYNNASTSENCSNVKVERKMSKKEYLEAFDKLQGHIQRGDIYEVNLCQEFFVKEVKINPLLLYSKLNSLSPTPFSCYVKVGNKFILSASPERFLAKRGNQLVSQPIKGTAPRGKTIEEDEQIKRTLRSNPKELAENVMIVDLVRNDLTKSALPGTVRTDKQFEIHSFKQVHQLISTISCQLAKNTSAIQAIKNTFPPGSMTGAPKISAMQLCEIYESSKRGIYSGAVGYFDPNNDFDFNVVIRSILYNQETGYLSFHTGGAITLEANGEKEYEECLLKASAILRVLNAKL